MHAGAYRLHCDPADLSCGEDHFGKLLSSGGSLVWFLVLSSASGMMMPLFQDPRRMRWVMGTAGVFLIFLSLRLSVDVYGWLLEMGRPEIVVPVTTATP